MRILQLSVDGKLGIDATKMRIQTLGGDGRNAPKPVLNIGPGGAAAADRVTGGGGFVHAPAPDTSKANEVRRRLEDA